jgi:tetratricopeptide (TPR) repeat protein
VWDKALTYYRQAGTKAMAGSAYREAVACFEHALDAVQHLPESRTLQEQAIDLRLELRNALFPLNEQDRLLAHLRQAESLAEALSDHQRLGQIFTYMASYCWLTGNHEDAATYGQNALASATALGDVRLQVMANYRLGQSYFFLGDYRRAIDCLRDNVAVLEGDLLHARFGMTGLPSVFSGTMLVSCLTECGEFAEGMTHGEDAMRIAEAVDEPFSLVRAYNALGYLAQQRGDFHQAISLIEQSLELCRVWNFLVLVPGYTVRLGYCYALSGQLSTALPLLEQVIEQATSSNIGVGHSFGLVLVAEVCLLAGRTEEARTYTGRALQLCRERHERGSQAYALRLLGKIAAYAGPTDIESADTHYRHAQALAQELGMRPLQAHCHLGLGKLYGQTGRVEHARTELSTAIDLYRDMEMTFWLPQTEETLARLEERS